MIRLFFRDWWKRRQRQIDKDILWPTIRLACPDRAIAEHTFIQHMIMDPAYNDWPIEDMREYASELP